MIDLQSPDVGRALSRYFQISGAGKLPFGLEQAVVPVVIVADLQTDVRNASRPFGAHGDLGASVGQYPHFELENPSNSNVDLVVERIIWYTQTTAFVRASLAWNANVAIAEQVWGRRSGATGAGLGTFESGTTALQMPDAQVLFSAVVSGNVPYTWDAPPGGLIVEPGGRLTLSGYSANLATSCTVLWREEGRL